MTDWYFYAGDLDDPGFEGMRSTHHAHGVLIYEGSYVYSSDCPLQDKLNLGISHVGPVQVHMNDCEFRFANPSTLYFITRHEQKRKLFDHHYLLLDIMDGDVPEGHRPCAFHVNSDALKVECVSNHQWKRHMNIMRMHKIKCLGEGKHL